jgi:hypothetical protein
MIFRLSYDIDVNVRMITRDRDGRILQDIRSHNIVINSGRTFLRDLMAVTSYDRSSIQDPPYKDDITNPYGMNGCTPRTLARPRYVAVGTGGVLQSYEYPGNGGFQEIVSVPGLERPIPVKLNPDGFVPSPPEPYTTSDYLWQWMKQVEPQTSDDPNTMRDSFSVTYRAIFNYDELSFPQQIGQYENIIPVTEILLLTSEGDPYVFAPMIGPDDTGYVVKNRDDSTYIWPELDEHGNMVYVNKQWHRAYTSSDNMVIGALAYNVTTPMVKTPNNTLEILWELRS